MVNMGYKRTSSFSIIIVFVCLAIVGLALIPRLSVKLNPSQQTPQVNVRFSMPGNSPRVIEMQVTSKLEAMLSRLKGIEKINSTSGNGWGYISIHLNKHTNIDAARFEISTIIRQTWSSLPKDVHYPTISISRSDDNANRPFLTYTINASANAIDIQRFANSNISPKLSQIEGVYKVNVYGAQPMEWLLEYNYEQLRLLDITAQDIQSAIQDFLRKEYLGVATIYSDSGKKQWLRVVLNSRGSENNQLDVSKIQVRNINGKLILLDQLVNVFHLESSPDSYYRINGLNSIYLSITAEDYANQLELSKKIKEEIAFLKKSFPIGYELYMNYDATEYIKDELNKIYYRTGLTLFILLFFVALIYRNVKYLLLLFISLFVNIAVAAIFYYLFKLEMQLYSLAGITISLTLIIDNTIIMSDRLIRQKNKRAYMAILAATVTTIGALGIIFFLEEKLRLNLLDFACVVIINLAVSLLIALFLLPALVDKLGIQSRKRKRTKILVKTTFFRFLKGKRKYVRFNQFYAFFCHFIWRWRVVVITFLILGFGLPIFLLPEKIKEENRSSKLYNNTLGSDYYKNNLKPYIDIIFGGSLRLFVQKVYQGSYLTDRGETSLYVAASLPNGSTMEQMNHLIQQMEQFISQFKGVKRFQTQINSAQQASIDIQFTKEAERSNFPYQLRSNLISQSFQLGGGSWSVMGFGDGFSNDSRESAGSHRVQMFGFNYDELMVWAEFFKKELLTHRRIRDVSISSEFSFFKNDYQEFVFNMDKERLAVVGISPIQLFSSLNSLLGKGVYVTKIYGIYGNEAINLQSQQSQEYDLWNTRNQQIGHTKATTYKLSELVNVQKSQSLQKIVKINQQYQVCIQYEYIGNSEQGEKVLDEKIEALKTKLPLGYSIKRSGQRWFLGKEEKNQYGLLFLIFVVIYFSCGILFNSLVQPLSIVFVIPISFIGIFLSFYIFDLNFDQGGFASFVLLCGISVNTNIYILNQYNNIRVAKPHISKLRAYIKAWNIKITPIFLTVVSTILGFIPFMIGEREAFWFPLAAGTIGGLIVSLIGSFLFLPLFMGVGKNIKV
jgi:multidrug efflux pump subunit AcrB